MEQRLRPPAAAPLHRRESALVAYLEATAAGTAASVVGSAGQPWIRRGRTLRCHRWPWAAHRTQARSDDGATSSAFASCWHLAGRQCVGTKNITIQRCKVVTNGSPALRLYRGTSETDETTNRYNSHKCGLSSLSCIAIGHPCLVTSFTSPSDPHMHVKLPSNCTSIAQQRSPAEC